MFRLLLVFSLVVSSFSVHSQNPIDITSCPDTVMVNSNIPCYGFLVYFTNNDSLPINAAAIDSANYQLPGTTQMVTFNGCASPIPGQPETIFIEPSDTLWAQFIYFPNGQTGTSSVDICFFDFDNSSDTVCSTIVINTSPTVSVEEENTANVNIKTYPNPFSDQLTVEYILNLTEDASLSLYDLTGKLVYSQSIDRMSRHSVIYPPKTSGTYLLVLQSESRVLASKKVVLR